MPYEFTKEIQEAIMDTNVRVRLIEQTLNGNGQEGLCKRFLKLKGDHEMLSRNFYILAGLLAGGGVISGGLIAF